MGAAGPLAPPLLEELEEEDVDVALCEVTGPAANCARAGAGAITNKIPKIIVHRADTITSTAGPSQYG